MAAIQYSGVADQIKSILEGDALTSGAHIYVEEEPQFGLNDYQDAVIVYLTGRTAPPNVQTLSAGKRTRYYLRVEVGVVHFSMETYRAACDGRNTLLGKVELVLMKDRTIGGKAETSWLEGGTMYSAKNPANPVWCSVAELALIVDVSAVNT